MRCVLGSGVAAAVAACSANAQNIPASIRPPTDPATQLQTLLNFQDAEFRKTFFANTPISERLLTDFGGFFRYGFSSIDSSQSQAQYLNTYDLRLYGRVELDGCLRFFGRLRFEYNDWNTIGDYAPSGQGWQVPIGEIYWAEIDLANWLSVQDGLDRSWTAKARIGRQYMLWANGLVLADYMYAGMFDASVGNLAASAIVGTTAGHDTTDWDTSRPGYSTDTDRLYAGGKLECHLGPHTPFIYGLAQWDQNAGQVAYLPSGSAYAAQTEFNYQSQYWGLGVNGALGGDIVYRTEMVFETGSTLSDSIKHDASLPPNQLPQAQVTDRILAEAGLAGLSWLAHDSTDARVDFQLLAGSGSPYRLDSGTTYGGIAPGKTDTSFNSLGYVNTGLVLAPEAANMVIPSIGFSFSPFKGHEVLGDVRFSATAFLDTRIDPSAPISVPVNFGGSNLVGSEYDFNVDWRLLSDLNMSFRYGVFVPNSSVFTDAESSPRQFFYVGATYGF